MLLVVFDSLLHTHAPRWGRDLVFNLAGLLLAPVAGVLVRLITRAQLA